MGQHFARNFTPSALYDDEKRREWRLEEEPGGRGPYIVELNLQHTEGLLGAIADLKELHALVADGAVDPTQISRTYYLCRLTWDECKALLQQDEQQALVRAAESEGDPMRFRAIYKLWPDFPVRSAVYRSLPTIKANAARRSFEAEGTGIVWAVIDSGIEGEHPHFHGHQTVDAEGVRNLHRSFVAEGAELDGIPLEPALIPDPDDQAISKEERSRRIEGHRAAALSDAYGHGTHVAGIIAGSAPVTGEAGQVRLFERVDRPNALGDLERTSALVTRFDDVEHLHGVAPQCRLVSLKVLDGSGEGRSSDVIRALEYVREKLNDNPKLLRVHGVNLSVGYEFDAEMFACGQSPLCAEVDRLVQSGVVVVAAAGNTGYGTVGSSTRPTKVGLSNTINDPGNAEQAITVGATHRDSPYMYGVSYFSSKGPTGDGRLKPDLVAPGERITSCGAGVRLTEAVQAVALGEAAADTSFADYMEDSGTSMAAPHVSGAIAAFLSIRREFIGKPREVKKIFTSTATPLGRERYFEGHGLVDLVRAIQSV
ncbi:S8 family peptidase [Nocardioides sp. STR2]|uniref:S8 family peptidase n=1 Tax=Nocardioides pini TaxID=2975053 RepID=A0ABT4CAB7_9ACTN|nr:S8 family peptidase [Nocardioides pini]MCY4725917.1 S8 family peptidase [Nocardioides pini]